MMIGDKSPAVSICLTTYNRSHLLPATIESLLSQTFTNFELIISDDCSIDNTEEVCLNYEKKDSRVKYYRAPHNLGMPGNLNHCVGFATGKYIANLHDGDEYRADLIEKWKSALDANPTAGFVFNAYESVDRKGRQIIYHEDYPELIPGVELGKRLLSKWNSCVFGTVMARRDVYKDVGIFDPLFENFSDVDMWLKIAANYDVAYINEPLMKLMPIDPARIYSFVHWKSIGWLLGIHIFNLSRYNSKIPDFVSDLAKKYPRRRRNLFFYNMLICVKHRRWDRLKEVFAIFRDFDDLILKTFGKLFGIPKYLPDWYNDHYWETIKLHIK